MLRHFGLQALLVFMQIEPDDVFTAGHGGRHGTGFQFENVLNQLVLLLAQLPASAPASTTA